MLTVPELLEYSISRATLVILVALIVVIIVVIFVVEKGNDEIPPSVATKYGEIQGYYKRSTAGHKYMAFEGIPYALPPIGERRFNVIMIKYLIKLLKIRL